MSETTLKLSQPAWLTLETNEGHSTKIDVYEARRMLEQAQKQPNEELRWKMVLDWLATKLTADRESMAENMAIDFHEAICAKVVSLAVDRKKKIESIAC